MEQPAKATLEPVIRLQRLPAISLFLQAVALNPDEAFEVGEFALAHPAHLR